ncbi:alginate O-acetyltransferase AlgX-related protein [Asticcacaulis solisilvae]|uniref:alginate O-acetyltransferase AlgX-related protein n=1 Tax=Asticcacaulis solisilvae TaxID=1217274 RepID=UPI003FD6DD30
MRILEGPFGHLFLNNDTNDTAAQFRGDRLITPEDLAAWKHYFQDLRAHADEIGIGPVFMVAPAKEEIFPDLYPVGRAEVTPVDQLMAAAEDVSLLFPAPELKVDRGLAYHRTDTHWSDYGARIAAEVYLRHVGLAEHIKSLPVNFRFSEKAGDLGRNLTPPMTEPWMRAKLSPDSVFAFDNKISNHGKIWIFQNAPAPLAETLVLFGDSFGVNLSKSLSAVFQRVVYCHTAAMWDPFVIAQEKPRYVLLEMAQRFIVQPPLDRKLWDSIAQKVSALDETERRQVRQHMTETTAGGVYAERMLACLEAADAQV